MVIASQSFWTSHLLNSQSFFCEPMKRHVPLPGGLEKAVHLVGFLTSELELEWNVKNCFSVILS